MFKKHLIIFFITLASLIFFVFALKVKAQENKIIEVNVKNFHSIQAAINCLQDGGTVYLPTGTYQIQEPLKIHSNITFRGDGEKSVIKNNGELATILLSGDKITETKIIKVEEERNDNGSLYTKIYLENHENFYFIENDYLIITHVDTEEAEMGYILSSDNGVIKIRDKLRKPSDSYQNNPLQLIRPIQNVIIQNLTIEGRPESGSAIKIDYGENIKIKENNILGNGCRILMFCTFNSLINKNSVKETSLGLTKSCGEAISLTSSNNNIITNNELFYNRYASISLALSGFNLIEGNLITGPGGGINGDGISLKNSNNNMIKNNIIRKGFCYGIWVRGSFNNIISENIVSGGITTGINVDQQSNNNLIIKNVITRNRAHGILLDNESSNNIVTNNLVNKNEGHGIFIYNLSCGNKINNNIIENNQGKKIFIEPVCTKSKILNKIFTYFSKLLFKCWSYLKTSLGK